jgi:hypothetical protein
MIMMESLRRPVLVLTGLLVIAGRAGAKDDLCTVLLVERPDHFVLCNKYQQRLTPDEYRLLPAVLPLVVVREFDRLNDGLTPCLSAEYDGSPMYLVRGGEGAFVRRGGGGSMTTCRNALLLGDTVFLLGREALRLRPAGTGPVLALPPRARAMRLFRYAGQTYVRVLSGTHAGAGGWVNLPESPQGSTWVHTSIVQGQHPDAAAITARLLPLITVANYALTSIFAELSPASSGGREPPAFHIATTEDALICSIEPQSMSGAFAGSMKALLPECERALLGTGVRPRLSGESIVIPLR